MTQTDTKTDCPSCGRAYETHPISGILTCFLHPSKEEAAYFHTEGCWTRKPLTTREASLYEALKDVRHWFLIGNNINHINALQETIKQALALVEEE